MSNLQEFVDSIREESKKEREKEIMTLGQFINALKGFNPDDIVFIEPFGLVPDSFISYRGYYEDLCLTYKNRDVLETVGSLLKKAESCIGKKFFGYKGGEFTMDRNSVLWCSEYGHASGMAIVDIVKKYDRYVKIICQKKDI